MNAQQTTIQIITPAQAADMLKRNTNNRPLNRYNIDFIKNQIIKGKWTLTHQGICIGKDGRIIDGQHRLVACVESKMPITVMVTVNADDEIFKFIDLGRRRKPSDILAIEGFSYYNEISSLSTSILKYKKNGRLKDSMDNANIQIDDIINISKQNMNVFYEIIKAEKRNHTVLIGRHLSSFLLWLIENEISEEYADKFWLPLVTGKTENQFIAKFRSELMNDKIRKLNMNSNTFILKSLHYLRCFINNKHHKFQDTLVMKEYVSMIQNELTQF